jgi:four helix bundle protein
MNHKDLEVYKHAMNLVTIIYEITKQFPEDERYGLTSQMRRAAVSIPSNIAEGSARNSQKVLVQFIDVAIGSSAELETQIEIAIRLKYIEPDQKIVEDIISMKRLLIGFRNHLKKYI